jgi:hypothetical protein
MASVSVKLLLAAILSLTPRAGNPPPPTNSKPAIPRVLCCTGHPLVDPSSGQPPSPDQIEASTSPPDLRPDQDRAPPLTSALSCTVPKTAGGREAGRETSVRSLLLSPRLRALTIPRCISAKTAVWMPLTHSKAWTPPPFPSACGLPCPGTRLPRCQTWRTSRLDWPSPSTGATHRASDVSWSPTIPLPPYSVSFACELLVDSIASCRLRACSRQVATIEKEQPMDTAMNSRLASPC